MTVSIRTAAALPSAAPAETAGVCVGAPGRLHLGFLDPSASLGRRFGSLGLVIDGFATTVELAPADTDQVIADEASADASADADRASAHLARLREATGLNQPLRLRLRQRLPAHVGLGSGTQLALAVGRAFARLHRLSMSTPALAHLVGRGLRSGVGIAGFDRGGLLLDGGPGADGRPAPLLSRLDFPPDWRVLVALDPRLRGLSGPDERAAIAALPPLTRTQSAEVCHEVLMRVLPGAADAEFPLFAAGLDRVQQVLGEHFAPAQGGSVYTSGAVAGLMQWLSTVHAPGATAVGQSSWGPTGFALWPSQAAAEAAVAAAHAAGVVDAGLDLRIVTGRNHGADTT